MELTLTAEWWIKFGRSWQKWYASIITTICFITFLIFLPWRNSHQWAKASSLLRIHDHTQRHTTVGRTPLDEWSARLRDLYLTKQNTHNRQISMSPVGFEPTILAGEQPQTHVLDCADTGTGIALLISRQNDWLLPHHRQFLPLPNRVNDFVDSQIEFCYLLL